MKKNEKLGQEPAFPRPWSKIKQNIDAPEQIAVAKTGMSKRFYSAQGFAEIFAKEYFNENSKIKNELNNPCGIIKIAYEFADELLKQENQ